MLSAPRGTQVRAGCRGKEAGTCCVMSGGGGGGGASAGVVPAAVMYVESISVLWVAAEAPLS